MSFNFSEFRDDYGGKRISRFPVPVLSNGLTITSKHKLDFSQAVKVEVTVSQLAEIKSSLIQGKTYTAGSSKSSRTIAIIIVILVLIIAPLCFVFPTLFVSIQNSDIQIDVTNLQELFDFFQLLFTDGLPIVIFIILFLLMTTVPFLSFAAFIVGLCIFVFQYSKKYMTAYTDAINNGQIDIYTFPVTEKYYARTADDPTKYYLEIGGTPVEVMKKIYTDTMIGHRVRCAIITGKNDKYFALL